jgi:hypothetical protein
MHCSNYSQWQDAKGNADAAGDVSFDVAHTKTRDKYWGDAFVARHRHVAFVEHYVQHIRLVFRQHFSTRKGSTREEDHYHATALFIGPNGRRYESFDALQVVTTVVLDARITVTALRKIVMTYASENLTAEEQQALIRADTHSAVTAQRYYVKRFAATNAKAVVSILDREFGSPAGAASAPPSPKSATPPPEPPAQPRPPKLSLAQLLAKTASKQPPRRLKRRRSPTTGATDDEPDAIDAAADAFEVDEPVPEPDDTDVYDRDRDGSDGCGTPSRGKSDRPRASARASASAAPSSTSTRELKLEPDPERDRSPSMGDDRWSERTAVSVVSHSTPRALDVLSTAAAAVATGTVGSGDCKRDRTADSRSSLPRKRAKTVAAALSAVVVAPSGVAVVGGCRGGTGAPAPNVAVTSRPTSCAAAASSAASAAGSGAGAPRTDARPLPVATIGDGVEVKLSNISGAGWGLFATRDFAANEYITEYDGTVITASEARTLHLIRRASHVRSLEPMHSAIDGFGVSPTARGRGGGSFANDPYKTPERRNAVYVTEYGAAGVQRCGTDTLARCFLQATSNIQKGAEIYVSYGSSYDYF